MNQSSKRNFGLDLLRVIACYLVVQVHTGEFYYIASDGTVINGINTFWVNLYNSIGRCAVPLFVMLTGYFLLPVKDEMGPFFKKRFSRVLIPFVIWCALYALYPFFMGEVEFQTAILNVLKIAINYGTEVGHLWYVYMLIGLYLFAPIISPWIKSAPRKGLELYLIVWGVTLCIPYIHLLFSEIWGECFWNPTPMLYYFTGFLGYAILGYYIKTYWSASKSWNYIVGILLLIIGYAITYYGFASLLPVTTLVSDLELTWGYGTINVAMMGLGVFLIIKNIQPANIDTFAGRIVTDISLKSYGIYLIHIMLLRPIYAWLSESFSGAVSAVPCIAAITFIASYMVIYLISLLPKSKYLVG